MPTAISMGSGFHGLSPIMILKAVRRHIAIGIVHLCLLAVSVAVASCNLPGSRYVPPTLTPLPAALASVTPSPSGPTPAPPTATAPPLPTSWEEIRPGFEVTTAPITVNNLTATVTLIRIDPLRYRLRMSYAPGNPGTISDWLNRTKALMVVNGGYFQRDNQTNGLLVVDEKRYGLTFDRHGGMLSVVDDKIEVRSLAEFPYKPTERLDQAVQGRPMLIYPGGFPVSIDDLEPDASRRTAVAQDQQGRIVFLVIDYGIVSLFRLRDWMTAEHPELELFAAFNLDGGTSTGLAYHVGDRSLLIDARSPLPSVIAIYSK